MTYMEIEEKVITAYKNIDIVYKRAVLYAFALINLAFLFHTINFMYGDHDWVGVRRALSWKDGAFEGRLTHHILQAILFDGQILPILNNMVCFFAMALSGVLLAHYWKMPKNIWTYTIFSTFIAVLPYTLVWLYYAKDVLANLTLPLTVVLAFILAEKAVKEKDILLHICSIALFFYNFSNYIAVINMIGVCFIGSIIIEYIEEKQNIINMIKQKYIVVVDIVVALVLFKIYLIFSSLTPEYNTKIISLDILGEKLRDTIVVMFTQFVVVLPFMEYKYKLLLLIMTLYGLGCLINKSGILKSSGVILLILLMLFASKFAYFIADERGELLTAMENYAYVPRLDFYGLVYVYAFALYCILSFTSKNWYKVGLWLGIIIVFMSMVRDMYAEKVWKFGYDAEMKAQERMIMRLEQDKNFYADRKYRILSIGALSLRKNYYKKQPNEEVSLDLLETSYKPEFLPFEAYNFFYPKDIFYGIADYQDLSEKGIDFILYNAKVWPAKESLYIDGDIVILILSEEKLAKARREITNNIYQ